MEEYSWLFDHYQNQKPVIEKEIELAARAMGGSTSSLMHTVEAFKTMFVMRFLGSNPPSREVYDRYATGLFSAFAYGGNIELAKVVLQKEIAPHLAGFDDGLKIALEIFQDLRRRNPEAARHVGNAVRRLHPDCAAADDQERDRA